MRNQVLRPRTSDSVCVFCAAGLYARPLLRRPTRRLLQSTAKSHISSEGSATAKHENGPEQNLGPHLQRRDDFVASRRHGGPQQAFGWPRKPPAVTKLTPEEERQRDLLRSRIGAPKTRAPEPYSPARTLPSNFPVQTRDVFHADPGTSLSISPATEGRSPLSRSSRDNPENDLSREEERKGDIPQAPYTPRTSSSHSQQRVPLSPSSSSRDVWDGEPVGRRITKPETRQQEELLAQIPKRHFEIDGASQFIGQPQINATSSYKKSDLIAIDEDRRDPYQSVARQQTDPVKTYPESQSLRTPPLSSPKAPRLAAKQHQWSKAWARSGADEGVTGERKREVDSGARSMKSLLPLHSRQDRSSSIEPGERWDASLSSWDLPRGSNAADAWQKRANYDYPSRSPAEHIKAPPPSLQERPGHSTFARASTARHDFPINDSIYQTRSSQAQPLESATGTTTTNVTKSSPGTSEAGLDSRALGTGLLQPDNQAKRQSLYQQGPSDHYLPPGSNTLRASAANRKWGGLNVRRGLTPEEERQRDLLKASVASSTPQLSPGSWQRQPVPSTNTSSTPSAPGNSYNRGQQGRMLQRPVSKPSPMMHGSPKENRNALTDEAASYALDGGSQSAGLAGTPLSPEPFGVADIARDWSHVRRNVPITPDTTTAPADSFQPGTGKDVGAKLRQSERNEYLPQPGARSFVGFQASPEVSEDSSPSTNLTTAIDQVQAIVEPKVGDEPSPLMSFSGRRASKFADAPQAPAPFESKGVYADKGRLKDRQRGHKSVERRGYDEEEDVDDATISRIELKRQRKLERRAQKALAPPTPILLPEFISISNLASLLHVRVDDFIGKLQGLGFEELANDHVIDAETAGLIAAEFNFEPITSTASAKEDLVALPSPAPEERDLLLSRPPVITIMGHVDHGKTTLLDWLRKSSVAASEHGGITQHIGAFTVAMPSGRVITFLDTPGHAAFLDMRARGANVTDIVILVVAADDSVKPQTLEAIKHAKAARVPIIVAINKIDKEDADPDSVKRDLAQHGVEVEDVGGDTQVVCVSGKTGQGMEELEDAAVALADVLDMRAATTGQVEGWVLEATTKRAGKVATVLVRRGTITPGAVVVAGSTWARVRTLRNEAGQVVQSAGPGTPIEVDGWREQPDAGAEVLEAPSEQRAREVVELRNERMESLRLAADVLAVNEARRLEELRRQRELAVANDGVVVGSEAAAEGRTGPTEVPFVLRADVSGSVEAISAAVLGLGNAEVRAMLLRSAVGPLSESDIELAATARGHVISFNMAVDNTIARNAETSGVRILDGNVIYRLVDDIKGVLEEHLPPLKTQRVVGEAEIAQIFEVTGKGRVKDLVAGCKVRNGVIERGKKVRVLRGKEVVYDGTLASLRNRKADVSEVRKDTECGLGFEGFTAFEVGDLAQSYEVVEKKRTL